MKQGRVYFPQTILPPGSSTNHRIIVLSNDSVIANGQRMSSFFLTCAIIRSATDQSGRPVRPIPGHSIPVDVADFHSLIAGNSVIQHPSIIETHQLFHISMALLTNPLNRALGDLNTTKLQAVLAGARKLLS